MTLWQAAKIRAYNLCSMYEKSHYIYIGPKKQKSIERALKDFKWWQCLSIDQLLKIKDLCFIEAQIVIDFALNKKGTKNPGECKFPIAVDQVELLEAIEILDVTKKAKASIDSVPVWTA